MSGFFSKDAILIDSLGGSNGNIFFFVTGVATAFLTAFYMTRLLVLVFFGTNRVSKDKEKHLHESPWVMTLPLMVLAVLSLVGGWLGKPYILSNVDDAHASHGTTDIMIMAGSVVMALIAAWIARSKYQNLKNEENPNQFLQNAWYWDAAYLKIFVGGTTRVARVMGDWIEEGVVQRSIRWVTALSDLGGSMFRVMQVGVVQVYLFLMLAALALVLFSLRNGVGGYGI